MRLHLDTYVGKLANDYVAHNYPNHKLVSLHQQPWYLRVRNHQGLSKARIKAVMLSLTTNEEEILILNQGDLR